MRAKTSGISALVLAVLSQGALAENLVLYYETPATASRGTQSSMYLDKDTLTQLQVEGLPYLQVRTKHISKATGKASGETIAVLCEGAPIAPALSVREMGDFEADGSFKADLTFGPVRALGDFNLPRLNFSNASNPFVAAAKAVCAAGGGTSGK